MTCYGMAPVAMFLASVVREIMVLGAGYAEVVAFVSACFKGRLLGKTPRETHQLARLDLVERSYCSHDDWEETVVIVHHPNKFLQCLHHGGGGELDDNIYLCQNQWTPTGEVSWLRNSTLQVPRYFCQSG